MCESNSILPCARRARAALMVAAAVLIAASALVPGRTPAARGGRRPADEAALAPVFHALPGGVEILRLENGLHVVLLPNPAQPMVGIYTQVRVGSAREDFRTSGMSHMLEHLLFNGTREVHPGGALRRGGQRRRLQQRQHPDFFTNYMMVIPAAHLETGLELQSQMLFHSLIPADKFAKEQGIVLGEMVQARDWPGHFAAGARCAQVDVRGIVPGTAHPRHARDHRAHGPRRRLSPSTSNGTCPTT